METRTFIYCIRMNESTMKRRKKEEGVKGTRKLDHELALIYGLLNERISSKYISRKEMNEVTII